MLGFFAEVDAELPPDESVEVVVIGGAAVMFLVPDRVTDDVDVISEDMPQVLSDAAARVARRHGLRPKWINDAARVGLPHLAANYEPVYSGERLIVHRADPKYLLATKLLAGRAVDVEDAVPLALAAGITTEVAMLDLLERAYPGPLRTPALQFRAIFRSPPRWRRPWPPTTALSAPTSDRPGPVGSRWSFSALSGAAAPLSRRNRGRDDLPCAAFR